MIRKCSWCGGVYGEKEPLSDPSFTHGICDSCYEEWKKRRMKDE